MISTKLLVFLIALVAACSPSIARADCVALGEQCQDCANKDCGGYCYSTCQWGCINGTCDPSGGGGVACCNTQPYDSAVIYSEPGGCEICGNVRVGANWQELLDQKAALRRGSPEADVSQAKSAPRMFYVLNQCSHRYELAVPKGLLPQPTGGM